MKRVREPLGWKPNPDAVLLGYHSVLLIGLFTVVFVIGGFQRVHGIEMSGSGFTFVVGTLFVALLLLRFAFGAWGLPRLGLLEWVCLVLQSGGVTLVALTTGIVRNPVTAGPTVWFTLVLLQALYLLAAASFTTWLLRYLQKKRRGKPPLSERVNLCGRAVATLAGFPLLAASVFGLCWVAFASAFKILLLPVLGWVFYQKWKWKLYTGPTWQIGASSKSMTWRSSFLPDRPRRRTQPAKPGTLQSPIKRRTPESTHRGTLRASAATPKARSIRRRFSVSNPKG